MILPRVGRRPLEDNFWTRKGACSNGFAETVGLTGGDIILCFFCGGSVEGAEGFVIYLAKLGARRDFHTRGLGLRVGNQ